MEEVNHHILEQSSAFVTTYKDKNEVSSLLTRTNYKRGTWHLRGLPFVTKTHFYLEVEFETGFGPQRGTWKGGTVSFGAQVHCPDLSVRIPYCDICVTMEDECEDCNCELLKVKPVSMDLWHEHLAKLQAARDALPPPAQEGCCSC
jgi:hypothetical protein